jgi:hypothetical protein
MDASWRPGGGGRCPLRHEGGMLTSSLLCVAQQGGWMVRPRCGGESLLGHCSNAELLVTSRTHGDTADGQVELAVTGCIKVERGG